MVLQHARSSFHIPWDKVEASRIVATSGAIALNIVILMLLLVPAARMAPLPDKPFTWYLPPEKVDPPPLPPAKPVPVTTTQRTPTTPTPAIPRPTPTVDPQPTEQLIDPMGTLPADPVPPVNTAPPTTVASTAPMVGAHLEYLHAPPPKYTGDLVRMRAEGTVLLQVLVGVDGKPIEVSILKSSGIRKLDELAQRSVMKWLFKPATRDGQPVQAIGNVPIDFTLQ